MQFVETVKIHQTYIVVLESHEDTHRIWYRIVGFLHDHAFQLSDDVSFLRLAGIGTDHAADDDVRMEILGHEVEVVTANLIYGVDIPSCRNREAYSMVRNYEIFKNCSVVGVETAMLEVNQEAAEWVNNNLKRLRRYK